MEDLNRIKEVLARKKQRQNALASHLGMSTVAISKMCSNHTQPSLKTLYAIADFLEVNVCELLVSNRDGHENN